MGVENRLLKLNDCSAIRFQGHDHDGDYCSLEIRAEDAQAILEHIQHTIRSCGSTKLQMKVIKGQICA